MWWLWLAAILYTQSGHLCDCDCPRIQQWTEQDRTRLNVTQVHPALCLTSDKTEMLQNAVSCVRKFCCGQTFWSKPRLQWPSTVKSFTVSCLEQAQESLKLSKQTAVWEHASNYLVQESIVAGLSLYLVQPGSQLVARPAIQPLRPNHPDTYNSLY